MTGGSMEGVKTLDIDLLIKKEGLDLTIYKRYRPVNMVPFISNKKISGPPYAPYTDL